MRIALTGSHSVGKSTLLERLDIPGHKKIKEIARQIIEKSDKLPHEMTQAEFFDFQMKVAEQQLIAESGDFISDRSVYDNLVYAQDLDDYEKIKEMVLAQARPYDFIFYLPIEFGLKVDEVRSADKDYQKLIDDRLKKFFAEMKIEYIEIGGDFETRIRKIQEILKKQNG